MEIKCLAQGHKKKPSTLEELERIDKEIGSLLQLKRRDGELEKQYVGTLVLYSVIVYFIMALVFYFYFVPEDWTGRAIQILPLLLFPFIIWLVRRLIRTYFTRRISRCEGKRNLCDGDLIPYLACGFTLVRYKNPIDSCVGQRSFELKGVGRSQREGELQGSERNFGKVRPRVCSTTTTPIVSTPSSGRSPPGVTPALRQRLPASGGRGRGRGRGAATPMIPTRQTPGPGTPWTTPRVTGQRPMSNCSTVMLNRCLHTYNHLPFYTLPNGIGEVATIIMIIIMTSFDYSSGLTEREGDCGQVSGLFSRRWSGNRFALICKHCYSHNGMALQEEFEYLAFRCPYCGTFNPSRKTRPNAPKLPESLPSSSAELASSGEDGSSSANEDTQPSNILPAPETDSTVKQETPADQGRVDETSDDGDNAETEVPLNDDGTGSEAAAAAVASPMNEGLNQRLIPRSSLRK
ncbi:hypothetical protein BSL78_02380 [Apostichopus japonicus]|uniref:Endoplasmic reticulum junction formation protein lunapark n=1 Tax=Stichopus japonicus TaxID=307972 RepID=A0A2G8LK99_STIJA|nr:hypothetical protein BSL78_02380 [Apostichopus japonicus]